MKKVISVFLFYFLFSLISTPIATGVEKNNAHEKEVISGEETPDREDPENPDILSGDLKVDGCENDSPGEKPGFINWSYKTNERIYTSPIADNNYLYFGNDAGNFYAIHAEDGSLAWKYEAGRRIRSTAAISENILCFQSGNKLIGLNNKTGSLVWQHDPEQIKTKEPVTEIDEWDYHHSSPLISRNIAYYGNDYGYFYGIDIKTGRQVFEFVTGKESPIRTKPVINENIIYFGDFEGYVYAVDLTSQVEIWSLRTYENKEYPQFGGIVSNLKIDGNHLFFGARNYNFQVLDKQNGTLQWKYTNASGGWISGSPFVKGGKVYVGGSDTHSLNIFDVKSGTHLAEYKFKNGGAMFSEPIFFKDYILVQTGDAYSTDGKGYLYILNEQDGSLVRELQISGNIFSTSLYHNNTIFVTSTDHSIYAIDLESLLKHGK